MQAAKVVTAMKKKSKRNRLCPRENTRKLKSCNGYRIKCQQSQIHRNKKIPINLSKTGKKENLKFSKLTDRKN